MEFSRIAPADGYDNEGKADYRRRVWDGLEKALKHHPRGGFFLIMPSLEGLEIEEALSRGIPEDRIVALDNDIEVFRNAHWVKRYPKIKCVCSELKDFGKVFPHRLVAANLDLCGRFSAGTIEQVEGFKLSSTWSYPFFLSINIARGREDSTTLIILERLQSPFKKVFSSSRMSALLTLCRINQKKGTVSKRNGRMYWEPIEEGFYVSARHPMTWATLQLANDRSVMSAVSQRKVFAEVHPFISGKVIRSKRPCRHMTPAEIEFIKRHAKIGTPGKNGSGNVRQLSAEMGIPYHTIYNVIGRNPNWNRREKK